MIYLSMVEANARTYASDISLTSRENSSLSRSSVETRNLVIIRLSPISGVVESPASSVAFRLFVNKCEGDRYRVIFSEDYTGINILRLRSYDVSARKRRCTIMLGDSCEQVFPRAGYARETHERAHAHPSRAYCTRARNYGLRRNRRMYRYCRG